LENKTVTVEAGIRVYKLNEILWEKGLALSNLGSISEQSIAGAVSTATHGSGVNFGNISSQVRHNLLYITFTRKKKILILLFRLLD
jgi:L-gulonolactone oxidase